METLDLSKFQTRIVIDMSYMFNRCTNLKEINLSSFNTEAVTDMKFMFAYCPNLNYLDLLSFETRKCTNFDSMFEDFNNLTISIDKEKCQNMMEKIPKDINIKDNIF